MPLKVSSLKKIFTHNRNAVDKELNHRQRRREQLPNYQCLEHIEPPLVLNEPPWLYWTKEFCIPTRKWIQTLAPNPFNWVYQELLAEFTRRDPPFEVLGTSQAFSDRLEWTQEQRIKTCKWIHTLDDEMLHWAIEEMYGNLCERLQTSNEYEHEHELEPGPRIEDLNKYQLEELPEFPPMFSRIRWSSLSKLHEQNDRQLHSAAIRLSHASQSFEDLGVEEEGQISNLLRNAKFEQSLESLGSEATTRFSTSLDTASSVTAAGSTYLEGSSHNSPYADLIQMADQDFCWARLPQGAGKNDAQGSECIIRRLTIVEKKGKKIMHVPEVKQPFKIPRKPLPVRPSPTEPEETTTFRLGPRRSVKIVEVPDGRFSPNALKPIEGESAIV